MNTFEEAARKKLRFEYHGLLSIEDLWDLPIEDLDELYGILMSEQKTIQTESLLKKSSKNSSLNLKISIVRHVVETLLQEDEARKNRANIKLQKEKIANIIQKKQDEGLENMSVEELQAVMDGLKS